MFRFWGDVLDKQQEGVVLETDGNTAKVKASRHTDCESCGACPGNNAIVIIARNPVGAQRGQRVIFEIEQISMVKSAFIVYATPLLATFIGVLLGWQLGGFFNYEDAFWFKAGLGALFFVMSLGYIRYYDRSARVKAEMQPVIIRIISN